MTTTASEKFIAAFSSAVATKFFPYQTVPDGLAIYEQRRDDIALVLLDWTMEGMSSEEVLDRLWSTNSQSKIFIISGYHIPSEDLADKAEALQKPL